MWSVYIHTGTTQAWSWLSTVHAACMDGAVLPSTPFADSASFHRSIHLDRQLSGCIDYLCCGPTLTWCSFNVSPPSKTVGQHWNSIRSVSRMVLGVLFSRQWLFVRESYNGSQWKLCGVVVSWSFSRRVYFMLTPAARIKAAFMTSVPARMTEKITGSTLEQYWANV